MRSFYPYALVAIFVSHQAGAQNFDFPQCNAAVLGPQKIQAQSQNVTDPQRVIELEQLLVDFRSIRENLNSIQRVPRGYAEACIASKKEMVSMHFDKLSETSRKAHRVLKTMAEILDVNSVVTEAVKFYDAAYESNSADTESALRSLKLTAGIEFQNYAKNQSAMTKDQKIAMMSKMLDRGYVIASNPKFSVAERIWALEQVRGVLAADVIRAKVEEPYWKRFLELDPNSDTALRELMEVYELRADYGKMSIYATKLSEHPRFKNEDVSKIGMALTKAEDYSALLKVGAVMIKKFPTNPDSWGYLGYAEQRLKLNEKAEEHLSKAISLKAKNPAFIAAYAALQEDQADRAALSKNWIDGMSKYREALKHNPNSANLKKKTAYLILDFNAESGFPKTSSTRKDMDYALGLMQEALGRKMPLMSDYAAAIQIAAHSSSPGSQRKLCDRYQNDRPSGLSIGIVQSCVTIYRAAGQEQRARGIVDLALSKVKDGQMKQEFLKTLR